MKLRQSFFELIEQTYFSAKSLLKELSSKKNPWGVYRAKDGFRIITNHLRKLWQYDADDSVYITTIEICANLTNILVQSLPECALKEHLKIVYSLLLELLPEGHSFQLSLFAASKEFGWEAGRVKLIGMVEWVKGLLNCIDLNYQFSYMVNPFKGYQGRQLTLAQAKS